MTASSLAGVEERALGQLDEDAIARDLAWLVQAPSVTGDERLAIERLAELCVRNGLETELHEHDLAELRRRSGWPGEEAARHELLGVTATLPGPGLRRLCLNGHVDVVGPGTEPWRRGPWSGAIEDGAVHGRGAVDMKGGVVAALHAMAAVRAAGGARCEVVFQGVASEEDGGLGTFAALERDARFDACLIPEPTALRVVCAQAGALTFRGVVRGRSAHAAFRRRGVSAIDRYVPLHLALHGLEREMNRRIAHPLMRELDLPYPVLVGQVRAGDWSSQVPDRLEFEGRVGVPVGAPAAAVRSQVEAAVAAADEGAPPVELTWTGGQFGSGETAANHPFTRLVAAAVSSELGEPARLAGIAYGADLRLFTERGIPCVLAGPGGLDLLHAVDERVSIEDVLRTARAIVRVMACF